MQHASTERAKGGSRHHLIPILVAGAWLARSVSSAIEPGVRGLCRALLVLQNSPLRWATEKGVRETSKIATAPPQIRAKARRCQR
uniref:Putative secreted peptide n=1 Tax=Anopheles braziliensis TaxID=58242 RepID=A0A2M3ZXH6_9DIPT